jgi:hypothetical protein
MAIKGKSIPVGRGAGVGAAPKKTKGTVTRGKPSPVVSALAALGGGVKPAKVKVAGKTMTTKPAEAGVGIGSAIAKVAGRAAAKKIAADAARDARYAAKAMPKRVSSKTAQGSITKVKGDLASRETAHAAKPGKVEYTKPGRTVSDKQRAAYEASARRMSKVQSKAKSSNIKAGTAFAAGLLVAANKKADGKRKFIRPGKKG